MKLNYIKLLMIACAVLPLLSCGGGGGETIVPGEIGFRQISSRTWVGPESARTLVIQNEDDWQKNIGKIIPTIGSGVNFQTETVLLFAFGADPSGSYGLRFASVIESGGKLVASVEQFKCNGNAHFAEVTHPAAAAVIPKTSKEVSFSITEKTGCIAV